MHVDWAKPGTVDARALQKDFPPVCHGLLLRGGVCILDPGHLYPSVSVGRLRKPAPLSEAKAQGGMAFLVYLGLEQTPRRRSTRYRNTLGVFWLRRQQLLA